MSRNLLTRSYEVLGLDQKIYLAIESGGFGDAATSGLPVAGGAIEHLTGDVGFNIAREDSAARSGRSVVTRLSKKKEVTFKLEAYIIPGIPDVLGQPTLPPLHALYLGAFGAVNTSDPTKIVYSLSNVTNNSFRLLEEATHYARLAVGLVADSLTFSLPGDGKAQVSSEGFGQDVYSAGEATLGQATTGVAQKAGAVIQDLTYAAKTAGQGGNSTTIRYIGGVALSVAVLGQAITVTLETGVSDADAVKLAIEGTPAADALVDITVSGTGTNVQTAFTPAVALTGGCGANDLPLATGQGKKFEVGAYVDVIDKDDGNTVKLSAAEITAINGDILTLDVASVAADAADFVTGHAPTTFQPVSSENALLGLKGSFSVDGDPLDCRLTNAEISLKQNFTKKDFIFGTSKICGFTADKRRTVGIKLGVMLDRDTFIRYMEAKKFVATDLEIVLEPQDIPAPAFTSGLGRTVTWRMPRVEFNVPKLEAPADKYVLLNLEGVAMAVDANTLDSEITMEIA